MEIGKKFYDAKRQRWFWVYTDEERRALREQMESKPHTILEVVEQKMEGRNLVTKLSNGDVVKQNIGPKEPGVKVIHYHGIPFNPNRGYIRETFDWVNKFEN